MLKRKWRVVAVVDSTGEELPGGIDWRFWWRRQAVAQRDSFELRRVINGSKYSKLYHYEVWPTR